MDNEKLHYYKCKLKYKYYMKKINEYNIIYNNLNNIFNNIQYNNKSIKLKKHFPINYFDTYDEYINKHYKCKNISFSMLLGDIDLQKKIILETIERRYNTIKVFSNNLNESITKNYILKYIYNINVMDLMTFIDVILYYNSPDIILKNYPLFARKDGNCMFEYVYSIKTENIHHYIDLKNMKLCDRILLCISKDKSNILKLNIMFQSSTSNVYKNIPSDKLRSNIETFFDNKLFHIAN